jgi:hypothetical protein
MLRARLGRAAATFSLCVSSAVPALGLPVTTTADELKKPAKDEAEITYTGFVPFEDGRAKVYVELTRAVPVEVSRAGRTVTYTLKGARVVIRNNRNPLLTAHFASIVESARLVSDKKATRLVVQLREEAAPSHRMVSRGRGAALEVDFPAPKAGS